MGTKINCSLTPKFVKPFLRQKNCWCSIYISRSFYQQFQSEKIKSIAKEIDLPSETKKILARLDDISSENSSLLIDVPVNHALLFCILSHKNAELIKRIVFADLKKFSIDKVKEKYANNIESFESLFKAKIPDEIFELYGFYESFRSIVDNEVLDKDSRLGIEVWLCGFENIGGIFQSIFSPRLNIHKKDILSLRHGHHDLSYFPVFDWGGDGVSHGFVFDPQLNEFTSCAYSGDGSYGGEEGLWPALQKSLLYEMQDILDSFSEYFEYLDDFDGFDDNDDNFFEDVKPTLTYQDLNGYLNDASDLWVWLLNFFAVEYLNLNEIKDLTLPTPNKVRYDENPCNDALTENGAYYISDTYPRIVLSIKDNFHPHLDSQIIKELLSIFGLLGSRGDLETFLENNRPVLEILPLDTFYYGKRVKKISKKSWNAFYKIMVDFAEKEASQKRYGLALLMGLLIWNRMEKETSKYAITLLDCLPDEVCHPLIKNLAREHGKTRFDRYIHI